MNSGSDPDRAPRVGLVLAQRRTVWYSQWVRAAVVFCAVAVLAGFVVPYLVERPAEPEEAGGGSPRGAGAGASVRWAGGMGSLPLMIQVAASDAGADRRSPGVQRAAHESAPATATGRVMAGAASADKTGQLYWVQVGVFRDAAAAKRVAQRLGDRKYRVQVSVTNARGPASPPPAGRAAGSRESRDRYEVLVSGGAPPEVAAKLTAKGLATRASADGIAITPSLPLSEAVALSRDLADDGFPVRVQRVGSQGTAPEGTSIERTAPAAGETLHRVRVGGFVDRATALATVRELEALGYKPFVGRGNE